MLISSLIHARNNYCGIAGVLPWGIDCMSEPGAVGQTFRNEKCSFGLTQRQIQPSKVPRCLFLMARYLFSGMFKFAGRFQSSIKTQDSGTKFIFGFFPGGFDVISDLFSVGFI